MRLACLLAKLTFLALVGRARECVVCTSVWTRAQMRRARPTTTLLNKQYATTQRQRHATRMSSRGRDEAERKQKRTKKKEMVGMDEDRERKKERKEPPTFCTQLKVVHTEERKVKKEKRIPHFRRDCVCEIAYT